MKKRINPPKSLGPYQEALKLEWPVSWWVAPAEQTCRSLTDPRQHRHELWLTELAIREPKKLLSDIVHELCRLYLAEQVDSVFSSIWFSEKWNRISKKETEKFNQFSQMINLAWSHVDIWVNQFRHKMWPELTIKDFDSFAQGVVILLERGEFEILSRPESLIGIAQYQAERERLKIKKSADLNAVLSAYGIKMDEQIVKLTKIYKFLPGLSCKKGEDLKILETSVREVVLLLGFPIDPRLVHEDGVWVWDLG